MNMTTKKDIFKSHLAEWLAIKGDRQKRGEMTKEISRIAKVHPKSVGRSFRRVQIATESRVRKKGRKTFYTKDADAALFPFLLVHPPNCLWHVGGRGGGGEVGLSRSTSLL